MTFSVAFNVDKVFLGSAKAALDRMDDVDPISDHNVVNAINVIVSCAACVEAYVNHLFVLKTNLKNYDELKLGGKIETLHNLKSTSVEWGRNPYQTFRDLVSVRNWLMHFKDNRRLGLIENGGRWREDVFNKRPSKDPFKVFSRKQCLKYYEETKRMVVTLGELMDLDEYFYDFALSDVFKNYIVM